MGVRLTSASHQPWTSLRLYIIDSLPTNLYYVLIGLKVRHDDELAVIYSGQGYSKVPIGQVVGVGWKMLA